MSLGFFRACLEDEGSAQVPRRSRHGILQVEEFNDDERIMPQIIAADTDSSRDNTPRDDDDLVGRENTHNIFIFMIQCIFGGGKNCRSGENDVIDQYQYNASDLSMTADEVDMQKKSFQRIIYQILTSKDCHNI